MNRSYWLTALLLSLSSNLDNVGVGVAYGIRRISVPFSSNLVIALITGTGTLAAILAGIRSEAFWSAGCQSCRRVAADRVGSVGCVSGVPRSSAAPSGGESGDERGVQEASLARRVLTLLDNPFSADQDFSRHIDRREALLLGIALSLNNVVNGVAAGIAGLDPMRVTILVCIFSVLTIWAGMSAGIRFGSRVAGRSTAWFRDCF